MKLKELVPPLGLCKRIPAGEFEDSALVYFWMSPGNKYIVIQRSETSCIPRIYPPCPCGMKYSYPAPTLQEIMEDLPHDNAYNDLLIGYSAKVEKLTGWHIYYSGDRKRHTYDQSAVTAAMKLWLKTKGIKHD